MYSICNNLQIIGVQFAKQQKNYLMTEYSLSCCGGSVKIIFDYSLKRESKLSSKISQISANIS